MSCRSGTPVRLSGILVLILATALLPAGTPVADAGPQSRADTPEPVVREELNAWTLGDGLLYWAKHCAGVGSPTGGYLRRKPANGGTERTLSTVDATHCETFLDMAADASGLYYYSQEEGGIYHRPVDDPYDPHALVVGAAHRPSSALELEGDYVYWASSYNRIYRVRKDGTGLQILADPAPNPTDLLAVGNTVYWLDDDGLWSTTVNCGSPPCTKEQVLGARGNHLLYREPAWPPGSYEVYWVTDGDPVESIPQEIRRYECEPATGGGYSCSVSTDLLYNADSTAWDLGQLGANGSYLYWPERKTTAPAAGRLRKMHVSGGTPVDIADGRPSIDERLFTDDYYVYFAELEGADMGISRLPFDASAIERDLQAVGLEVTQGIQNMAHDVPLVADKTTYVRAYAENISGPDAWNVEAVLHGKRDGQTLNGSPLWPLSGPVALVQGATYDRAKLGDGWLFQLPPDWLSGDLQLELEVDPRELYIDPNRANNTTSDTFTFNRKAPVCHIYIPVKTHAPSYFWPSDNPNFYAMLYRARTLWPVYDILEYSDTNDIRELEWCEWHGIYYLCRGPFELPDDGWKVLFRLANRDHMEDPPPYCEDVGANEHYIGMVHPDTPTGATDGEAYIGQDAAWVKFQPHLPTTSPRFDWPGAGVTLAHELGHNLGRGHVKCPDSGPGMPEGPYDPYPYITDTIGIVHPDGYYGFDYLTGQAIAPDGAADFMSYCSPEWVSDYTWEAIYDELDDRSSSQAQTGADLAAADAVVYARGAVTPSRSTGSLDYAWVYPSSALSAGILQKWQRLAAVPAPPDSYRVRLLDAGGGVLAEHGVTLSETVDDPAEHQTEGFALTFPAPASTVSRIELLVDGDALDEREPGPGVPTVTIQRPAGGETIEDEIQIVWQASDPDADDELLFNVQYSPNDGSTWFAVLTDMTGPLNSDTISVTLDASSLHGSGPNQARIRVAASDGYNTGLDLSEPFTVTDRGPKAYVVSPAAGETAPAGPPVLLRGGAMDVEDGPLSGADLSWTVDGKAAGQGVETWLEGWAPGEYDVVLAAQDSAAQEGTAQATLEILPLGIPEGDVPSLDGFCEDEGYADGAQIQLELYDDGSRATVHLVRSTNHLWACFSGMIRGGAGSPADAGLRIDPDYSRDAQAQTDDYGFFVGEDGGYYTQVGNGVGSFSSPGPGGLQAQVSATDNAWSAELRIDASVLGGWGQAVGLALGHHDAPSESGAHFWPFGSGWGKPNTWAETVLGTLPRITGLDPTSATAGGAAFELEVTGEDFVDGAQVRWDAAVLSTGFISSTLVSATVSAQQIANAGEVAMTVRNPGGALDSNPVPFVVYNPVPEITSLKPSSSTVGGPAFTLTVNGSGFVEGAEVLWNGTALSTTFASASRLTAQVGRSHTAEGREVGVTVRNPEPGSGASEAASFLLLPGGRIYLPLVLRNA